MLAEGAKAKDLAPDYVGRVPAGAIGNLRAMPGIPCMISEPLAHAVSTAKSDGGPSAFVTSDQCAGCHDASGTLAGTNANMIFDPEGVSPANLSPYGEWRYSMMGLAGRDPIFFAQLDTESTLHNHLAGKPDGAAFVDPGQFFTRDLLA